MTRHFSSRELSYLRNAIPVERVIVSFLSLQHRRDAGKLRFACPLCGGFDTSIQAKTNLARCFSCKRNFNPIELVMEHLRLGFVESVNWLKNRAHQGVNETPSPCKKVQASPIGEILSAILPSQPPPSPDTPSSSIPERVTILEKNVERLSLLIEKLLAARSPHPTARQ